MRWRIEGLQLSLGGWRYMLIVTNTGNEKERRHDRTIRGQGEQPTGHSDCTKRGHLTQVGQSASPVRL